MHAIVLNHHDQKFDGKQNVQEYAILELCWLLHKHEIKVLFIHDSYMLC